MPQRHGGLKPYCSSERSIQAFVVIENSPRAVNIRRRADFLRNPGKIDILTIEMPIAITKGMHQSL